MEQTNKGKHLLVVYFNSGEHLMIGYDKLVEDVNKGRLELFRYKEFNVKEKVWIATFYRENVAGWEVIK